VSPTTRAPDKVMLVAVTANTVRHPWSVTGRAIGSGLGAGMRIQNHLVSDASIWIT